MASAIGFKVLANDPFLDADAIIECGAVPASRDEIVEQSDVLSLHVPLLDSTRRIIDADALGRMRPQSILINVSRGGLVDEEALAAALRSGHLSGAGIDTFEHEPLPAHSPLRGLEQVILTPHSAALSREALDESRRKVVEEAARMLRGEPPHYPVNSPAR